MSDRPRPGRANPATLCVPSHHAPTRACQVWKHGTYLRVDGSLMGLDDKSSSLIPQWKRGHFSLVFDGSQQPAALHFLDHRKGRFYNLNAELKKQTAASLETEVRSQSVCMRGGASQGGPLGCARTGGCGERWPCDQVTGGFKGSAGCTPISGSSSSHLKARHSGAWLACVISHM